MTEPASLLVPALAGLLDALHESAGGITYLLLVAGLCVGALGVPIPEEAVLAVGGALAATGRASVVLVYLLGWAVVLGLDAALHAVGGVLGPRIEGSRWGRRLPAERWARLRDLMARRGVWMVVAARFVMGVRIPAFLLAGASGMPRGRFLVAVGLAGLASSAIPVALGYFFGAHLEAVLQGLAAARWLLLVAAVLLVVAWWWRRRS